MVSCVWLTPNHLTSRSVPSTWWFGLKSALEPQEEIYFLDDFFWFPLCMLLPPPHFPKWNADHYIANLDGHEKRYAAHFQKLSTLLDTHRNFGYFRSWSSRVHFLLFEALPNFFFISNIYTPSNAFWVSLPRYAWLLWQYICYGSPELSSGPCWCRVIIPINEHGPNNNENYGPK